MCKLREFVAGCVLAVVSVFLSAAHGQTERFELGKRVHRFEVAWQKATAEDRIRAVEPISKAVTSFFSLRLLTAAEFVDQAYFVTSKKEEPSDFERWSIAQHVLLERRLFRQEEPLRLRIEPFYPISWHRPATVLVQIALQSLREAEPSHILLADGVEFDERGWEFSLSNILEADYRLIVRMNCGSEAWEMPPMTISVAANLNDRLMKLSEAVKDKSRWESGTLRSSLRSWNQLFKSLSSEATQETDYPAVQLLTTAESLTADPNDLSPMVEFSSSDSGVWMNLVSDNKTLPVRFRLPKNRQRPFPVLVAYHGAGGSENMFFETYGAGRTIDLAIERGWIIVCPRQGLLGLGLDLEPMLDELARMVPIDKNRVYVMGHSMGAAQVIQQALAYPQLPKASAALGGGRGIVSVPANMNFPWFVGAGEQDFGKAGAWALASSLEKGGRSVTYREYPNVEHLVIVQAALDDVFDFFDQSKD